MKQEGVGAESPFSETRANLRSNYYSSCRLLAVPRHRSTSLRMYCRQESTTYPQQYCHFSLFFFLFANGDVSMFVTSLSKRVIPYNNHMYI